MVKMLNGHNVDNGLVIVQIKNDITEYPVGTKFIVLDHDINIMDMYYSSVEVCPVDKQDETFYITNGGTDYELFDGGFKIDPTVKYSVSKVYKIDKIK